MATKKGKSDDSVDESPKKEKKGEHAKVKGKSAGEMWQEINASVAKDEMNELREEVKKPKRKRKRRKKKVEKVVELEEIPAEPKEIPAEPGGVTSPVNPFAQPSAPLPDMPAETSYAPMNPFVPVADSTLPPMEYERRYDEGDQNFAELSEPEELEGANKINGPINPFEPQDPFAPIDEKPLDEKPIDQTDSIPDPEHLPMEEERIVEDIPDSNEQQSEKFEDTPNDYSFSPDDFGSEQDNSSELKAIDEQPNEVVHEAEVVEVESQPLEGHVELDGPEVLAVEEFKEEFWDILEQAGITKKILIGIILFIVVGVIALFFFVFGGSETIDEATKVDNSSGPSKADGIISSYIIGEEFKTAQTPIETVPITNWGTTDPLDAAVSLGGFYESEEIKYAYYVRVLREMSNIYNTGLYGLLDLSIDRRITMDRHLEEMNSLIVEAEGVLVEINLVLDNLDLQYTPVIEKRDLYEQQFFAEAESLNGQEAFTSLETYMGYASNAVKLKGYFSSYNLLAEMYVNSLDALKPRYRDILTNKEALIKGVRVFDIPDSDIDAIIHLSQ